MIGTIYKICAHEVWAESEVAGRFVGAGIDLIDGYIHFSTAAQVKETARKHFKGQKNLLLIAVDPAALGDRLKYEPSRGGDLFPHLYAELPMSAVLWVKPLPVGEDGEHLFPALD
jgi:uncharacterized protein (DUF952 family)